MEKLIVTNSIIHHEYIYDNYKNNSIHAFKQALIVKSYPGISVCLNFFNDGSMHCNGNNIDEEITEFNDYLETIRDKNPQFRGKVFYGIVIGKEIVNQKFVEDEFIFYVFACFDKNSDRWYEYSELKSLVLSNYYNFIKICPTLGNCNSNYNEFKKFLNDDIYSILIFPYPQLFLNINGILSILEYPNPIYQEEYIDYSSNPDFVFKELDRIILDIFYPSFFRTSLTKFCFKISKKLDDLKIDDLYEFKNFILNDIVDVIKNLNNERVNIHYKLFLKLCRIYIRKKYIDFLIIGI